MIDKKTVLVTGVSGFWGSRMASRLLALSESTASADGSTEGGDQPLYHVIGMDSEPPKEQIKGLDFVQADIRNPLLVELLLSEKVDTIVHLGFRETTRPSERAFDLNVIGAMKVMGAAAEAEVRKVVLRSSTMVYGAKPTNPSFLTEDHPLNGSRSSGTVRNLSEIEAFLNGFRNQTPGMIITTLRFANVVGPAVDSAMTRYLKMPAPPILLGFDPLIQVIHENDALAALVHCVQNDFPGAFNLAATDHLPLAKLLGLSGKFPFPVVHLFAYWGSSLMNVAGMKPGRYFPIEPDYLRYSWVADLARMQNGLGFLPSYTAEEALREFAGILRLKKFPPENPDLEFDEVRLRDTLERRRRVREGKLETAAPKDV